MADDSGRLEPLALEPLPLGAITPRGWLRRQLHIQAEGLTGHLDEFWPDLADNQWLGGENDGWERGPYYADGLVPLAHLLDDDDLRAKAEPWVEAFLDADEDGWVGPVEAALPAVDEPYSPWPRFVVLKVLRQHYEATGDERVLPVCLDLLSFFADHLEEEPLDWWSRDRWQELVLGIHWVYGETGEEWLLELADLAAEQGFGWTEHFLDMRDVTGNLNQHGTERYTHIVNNAMGIKTPGLRYRRTGDDADREAVREAVRKLEKFHGQATGAFTGAEHLLGKDPAGGTELCAVVEYMFSLEQLVSVTGDPELGDRLERLAFNALPATFKPDMWAHQYDQQANQVVCDVAQRDGWTNGPDANIYGLAPNYGCCTANMHQGWPKFASHLWMRTAEGGLAAVAYAPCEVTASVDDTPVTLDVETDYPFGDTVEITVDPEGDAAFPLDLRVPSWAGEPTLDVGGETAVLEPGTYHSVSREWTDPETLELDLSPAVEVERRFQGSVALRRGPLVFSLPVEDRWKLVDGTPPHGDWEVHPESLWNYGLAVDTDAPGESVDVSADPPGEVPFSPDGAPVEATVPGRLVPGWRTEGNSAGTPPQSPVRSEEPAEDLTLVPYGCTNLRVTEFPLLDPAG